jgi:hypothetical protein
LLPRRQFDPKGTARPAPRRARSTATSSRFAAGISGSGGSTASAASTARVLRHGSTVSSALATASPLPGRSRSSIPSTRSHERLRARHQLGGDDERAAASPLGAARLREGSRRLPDGARGRSRGSLRRRLPRFRTAGSARADHGALS